MSYLFFVDDTEKGSPGADYLPILGGIVVKSSSYQLLKDKFYSLKKEFGLRPEDPIKWSPGQNDDKYNAQKSIKKINVLRYEVLKFIKSSRLTIIVSVIDADNLTRKGRQFYLEQSIDHLAKRFHYMSFRYAEKENIMILDYPGHKEESNLISCYRKLRMNGASSKVMLSSLTDSIFYSHGFACDGLQLADFVVGCIGYTLKKSKYNYYNLIKGNVRSVKGKMKGAGLIVFPSNSKVVDDLC
jgi:hypothetical protein